MTYRNDREQERVPLDPEPVRDPFEDKELDDERELAPVIDDDLEDLDESDDEDRTDPAADRDQHPAVQQERHRRRREGIRV